VTRATEAGSSSAQARQRRYYESTAADYDRMHVGHDDEHGVALAHIESILTRVGAASVLDVGCGTGRGIAYLLERRPDLDVKGVEPVEALIERAVDSGVPRERLVQGVGEELPFPDDSFDAVMAIGVLHHVPDAAAVVAEMQRVARLGVFISDDNRFGRGPLPVRLLKLVLSKARLWRLAFRLRRLGRDHVVTEADGVAYSYAVYDSVAQFADWADRLELTATDRTPVGSWFHPLLTSPHVLLCATREPRG
jgi:ubiquinone/menaquinone biosynthesis C-methylase UbiE